MRRIIGALLCWERKHWPAIFAGGYAFVMAVFCAWLAVDVLTNFGSPVRIAVAAFWCWACSAVCLGMVVFVVKKLCDHRPADREGGCR